MQKIVIVSLLVINFVMKPDSDSIIGTFYSGLYTYNDLQKDFILKKEIPTVYSDVYKPEEDIGWKMEFLKNGKIKFTDLAVYYCGFDRMVLEQGKWKKITPKMYEITIEGVSHNKHFSKTSRYVVENLDNGDKRLSLNKE